jgi:hypothetical protein
MPGDFLNPKALATQVRRSEGNVRFSRGESASKLASLADDATRVVTDQIPNSGTTQRSLYTMMLLGGPTALTNMANSNNGLVGLTSRMLLGPTLGHHAMYGRGPLGAKHLAHGAFGEKMSNKALEQLAEKSPALFAALMESMRQREEGQQ